MHSQDGEWRGISMSGCLTWSMLNELSLGILTATLRDVNPIVQMGKLSLRGYMLKVIKLSKGRGWDTGLGLLASSPCPFLCTSQATAGKRIGTSQPPPCGPQFPCGQKSGLSVNDL